MVNPYRPPKQTQQRVFTTPLIVPVSIIVVILIYAGYVSVFLNDEQAGLLASLKSISFEVFLLCEIGIISLLLYNKKLLDSFLGSHQLVDCEDTLEILKPIIRTNMYSALLTIFFLVLGSLTAIMTILNYGLVKLVTVAILSTVAAILLHQYNASEKKVKYIRSGDEALEVELNNMLQCWMHKPLPNF